VVSDIGAERIGSASWISCDRMTTSMLDSGSASPRTSSVASAVRKLPPPAPWLQARCLQLEQLQRSWSPRLVHLTSQGIRRK
jgi:hypothetical protein